MQKLEELGIFSLGFVTVQACTRLSECNSWLRVSNGQDVPVWKPEESKNLGTTFMGYIGIIGYILGLLGLYRHNGK